MSPGSVPSPQESEDDCAVIEDRPGTLVVSVDLAVEGVHFRREWLNPEEIGWRAAAAALSDLAAEGAEAVGVLASVGLPHGAPEDELLAVMSGIGAAAREAGGAVLGGDLSTSEQITINVTVIGRAALAGDPRRRQTWRRHLGDGQSSVGPAPHSRAWQRGGTPSAESRAAFAHPVPRMKARTGAGQGRCTCDARHQRRTRRRRPAPLRGVGGAAGRLISICLR